MIPIHKLLIILQHYTWSVAVVIVLALDSYVIAKRYCLNDEGCSDLGDLQCIKSMCEWGVCGCPYGKGAKYLGSDRLYQCVPCKYQSSDLSIFS